MVFQEHVTLFVIKSLHVGTSLVQASLSLGPPGYGQEFCSVGSSVVERCWRPGQDSISRGSKQELSSQDSFLISESGALANARCLGVQTCSVRKLVLERVGRAFFLPWAVSRRCPGSTSPTPESLHYCLGHAGHHSPDFCLGAGGEIKAHILDSSRET